MIRTLLTLAMVGLVLVGCESTTDPEPETTFTVTIENVASARDFAASGAFDTPVGASAPGPIFPGDAYEFSFDAASGSKLSFATMFVQSNDLFYAPDGDGIDLYDAMGNQNSGDITSQIMLWDAGSEINQEPGLGSDQAPRQAGANTGAADANTAVRLATDDFGNLPAVSDVIEVTLSSTSATGFTVRVENVSSTATLSTSDGNSHAVPMAPGVWVVHTTADPLFTADMADHGDGLVAIAEDGDPSALAAVLEANSGVTEIIAPGVWAVHSTGMVLFSANAADAGEGLEALAEDGDPAGLASAVESKSAVQSSGVFSIPVGATAAGPVTPGASYSFTITAMEGDYLSLATMLVQSNDLFFAPGEMGLALYSNGSARNGDITSEFMLWDAGTEVNEAPGAGMYQAPRQSGADMGMDESGVVQLVNDGFSYPDVSDVIRVTLTIQ